MFELTAFVDAQKTTNPSLKIFPLFYKLEVSDLKDTEATNTRMAKWKEMTAVEERINPDAWANSVSALARANGEVFSKYGGSEVKYRKAVVDAVCDLCRPYVESSVPSMVGRDRLCNTLLDQIVEGEFKKLALEGGDSGPQKLGLYGQGGMGKTFICKALCDHFDYEFSGRVCYIEYSKGGFFELLKIILEELANADEHLKRLLPKQVVFLALDNLQDDDQDWFFLKYLSTKSKVVVTSRSLGNVKRVLGDNVLCLAVPALTVSEALKLFVQSAGCTQSLTEVTVQEMEILMKCVAQGFFKNDPDSSEYSGHHNPLLLDSMGFMIKEDNLIEVKQLLKKCNRIQNLQSYKRHTLSDILNPVYYETLTTKEEELLFSVAVLYPVNNLSDVAFVELLDRLLSWMEVMNGSSWKEILHKLGKLKDFHRAWDSHKKPQDLFLAAHIIVVLRREAIHKLDAEDEDKQSPLQCINRVFDIYSIFEGEGEMVGKEMKGDAYKIRGAARKQLNDVKGSLEDFEKAYQLMPDDGEVLRRIGAAKATLRDIEGAMEAYNHAIHLKPNCADSFIGRALAKELNKDREGALIDIHEGLRLEPNHEGGNALNDALRVLPDRCDPDQISDFVHTHKSKPL